MGHKRGLRVPGHGVREDVSNAHARKLGCNKRAYAPKFKS
jgi:hypothetical protein